MDKQEASQAVPSSAGLISLQEKYNELDSIFASQLFHRSSATQGVEDDTALVPDAVKTPALDSTIEHWCSRLAEAQRANQELELKQKSLQELHDKQQQMILNTQMEVEQVSSKLDGAMKNRETLLFKVQHACGVGSAFQKHCENVNASMSQLSSAIDGHVHEATELLDMFHKLKNDEKLKEGLEEIRRLDLAILEQRLKRENKEKEFNSRRENIRIQHETRMAQIHKETAEVEAKLQNQHRELAAAKHRCEVIQKRILMSENDDEINELVKENQSLEKKIKDSIETRLEPIRKENVRLSALSNNLYEENSTLTARLEVLEEEKIKIAKECDVLSEKLVEADIEESDLSDKLQKMHSMNLEKESQLVSLRNKVEDAKVTGQRDLSELETKLLNTKEMASKRSASIKDNIAATRKNYEVVSKRCDEKKDALSAMESQCETAKKLLETALEQQHTLEAHSKTMDEEKQWLSSKLQELKFIISIEEKKQAHLDELHQRGKQSAEEKENTVKDQIKAIEEDIVNLNEEIAAKVAQNELLSKKLELVQRDTLQSRELVHDKFNPIIDELNNKIVQLGRTKEMVAENHQNRFNMLTEELDQNKKVLLEMENYLLETKKSSNSVSEEAESLRNNLKLIQQETESKKASRDELVEKCNVLERNLELQMTVQTDMAAYLQGKEELLKSKTDYWSKLQQDIQVLEKSKGKATVQYCDEIKKMMQNLVELKQTNKAQSSTVSLLNEEVADLKSKCDTSEREYDSKQELLTSLDTDTEMCKEEIAQGRAELDKIVKTTEKLEKKTRTLKRDKLSSNQLFQTLHKGIAASKARKGQLFNQAYSSNLSPARDASQTTKDAVEDGFGRNIIQSNQVSTPEGQEKKTV